MPDPSNTADFKVAAFEHTDDGIIVVVKVRDKGIFAKFRADRLVADADVLARFTQVEKDQIHYAAATGNLPEEINIGHPRQIKIKSKVLNTQTQKYLFTLESTCDGISFVKKLYTDELLQHKSVLEFLDKEDIYEIAHAEGVESILVERDEIERAKKEFE